jgi:RNA polymerase sigma factor (TIGR02999 family)
MASDPSQNLSTLLKAWSRGDPGALNDVVTVLYPEIRKIARRHLGRHAPQQTLESAAIANEAYVRLSRARGLCCENRAKFLALCAHIIRRLIGEYARARRYAKRGGGAVNLVLDEEAIGADGRGADLLALDEALEVLAQLDPRKASLVEQYCFGGLTIEECAELLGISPRTAKRDWKFAKAWLRTQLTGKPRPDHVLIEQ